jgi:formamidopyrimidine-DNA glycosylase
MPELPEVEVTRRALAPHVEGRTVRRVLVRDRRLSWPIPAGLARTLGGREILALERRGKYLLWRFAHGTLISHLGMSGSWRVHLATPPPPGAHDHVDIVVGAEGRVLRLTDPRRFGALLWHPQRAGPLEAHPALARLGIEPFDQRFDGKFLHAAAHGRRVSIKQFLLAGDVVVGVGNIYASESLFRAGIHPCMPATRLTPARAERLAAAIPAVLGEAIEVGGSTLRDFVGADGAEGYFMVNALVYDRAGQRCRRCGGTIRRIVQGQRATYYCARCQRR